MKTLKFKTNVNCGGCITNITPHLNEIKGISNWTVDTANPMRVLTVESEVTSPAEIINALNAAGYKADLLAE